MCSVRELKADQADVSRSTSQEERVTAFLAHHPEVYGGYSLIVPVWFSTGNS